MVTHHDEWCEFDDNDGCFISEVINVMAGGTGSIGLLGLPILDYYFTVAFVHNNSLLHIKYDGYRWSKMYQGSFMLTVRDKMIIDRAIDDWLSRCVFALVRVNNYWEAVDVDDPRIECWFGVDYYDFTFVGLTNGDKVVWVDFNPTIKKFCYILDCDEIHNKLLVNWLVSQYIDHIVGSKC